MAVTTVNKLIEDAFRIIGLNGDDRNLSGPKTAEGLEVLNELLDEFFSDDMTIAYYSEKTFNLVVGQRSYEFSNQVSADVTSNKISVLKYVNIIDSNMRCPIEVTNDQFQWDVRHNDITQTRPWQAYLQNENFASFIVFNYLPDKAYECKVKAKFALSNVTASTDLTEVPIYYNSFLKYALARELSDVYPFGNWNEKREKIYLEKLASIKSKSDLDIIQKVGPDLQFRRRLYRGINPY